MGDLRSVSNNPNNSHVFKSLESQSSQIDGIVKQFENSNQKSIPITTTNLTKNDVNKLCNSLINMIDKANKKTNRNISRFNTPDHQKQTVETMRDTLHALIENKSSGASFVLDNPFFIDQRNSPAPPPDETTSTSVLEHAQTLREHSIVELAARKAMPLYDPANIREKIITKFKTFVEGLYMSLRSDEVVDNLLGPEGFSPDKKNQQLENAKIIVKTLGRSFYAGVGSIPDFLSNNKRLTQITNKVTETSLNEMPDKEIIKLALTLIDDLRSEIETFENQDNLQQTEIYERNNQLIQMLGTLGIMISDFVCDENIPTIQTALEMENADIDKLTTLRGTGKNINPNNTIGMRDQPPFIEANPNKLREKVQAVLEGFNDITKIYDTHLSKNYPGLSKEKKSYSIKAEMQVLTSKIMNFQPGSLRGRTGKAGNPGETKASMANLVGKSGEQEVATSQAGLPYNQKLAPGHAPATIQSDVLFPDQDSQDNKSEVFKKTVKTFLIQKFAIEDDELLNKICDDLEQALIEHLGFRSMNDMNKTASGENKEVGIRSLQGPSGTTTDMMLTVEWLAPELGQNIIKFFDNILYPEKTPELTDEEIKSAQETINTIGAFMETGTYHTTAEVVDGLYAYYSTKKQQSETRTRTQALDDWKKIKQLFKEDLTKFLPTE